MLHSILSKLPKPLNLESLIQRTSEIYARHPPERLPGRAWSRVSANSVLKTTHDPAKLAEQTLCDGEVYFEKQAAEIKRAEDWKRRKVHLRQLARQYRRPVKTATYASGMVMIVVVAYWLRNSGWQTGFASFMPVLGTMRQRTWTLLQSFFP